MSERSNRTKGKPLTPEEQAKLDEAAPHLALP